MHKANEMAEEQSLKEKTAKGIFWGGLSNGIQQLLNLLFGIFLARLLSPADYGMVGMLTVFSLLATSLQESGFTVALINLKKPEHRDYNAVFWFCAGLSCLLYTLLFFAAPLIARFYHTPEITPLARFVFLGFVCAGLGIVPSAYMFCNLMVKQRAISQITGLIVAGFTGITLAYFGFAYWGIATHQLVYMITIYSCYWYFSAWRPKFNFDFSPIRRMFGFSYKLLITNFFNIINQNILSVVLGRFYSEREVGYYNQAYKWNNMGQSALWGTINSVAQPVLARVADERERQQRIFRKMMRFAAFISFPTMLGLGLVSEELIAITITDKWLPSAQLMQILCIWGAFFPISSLYQQLIFTKGNSARYMWNFIASGLLVLASFLLAYPYGIRSMVFCYVGINIGWLPIWHLSIRKETGLRFRHTILDILPYAFIALCCTGAAYWLTLSVENIFLRFFAKIGITAALYLATLWLCRSVTMRESFQYLGLIKRNDR